MIQLTKKTFVYRLLDEELTLHTSIFEYYEAYPDPTIEFLYKDDSSDDDDEVDPNWHWSFSKRNRDNDDDPNRIWKLLGRRKRP